MVSPVKKAPVVTAAPVAVVRSGDHRSQSPKLMEVLNSIDAAREFVGNVAANRQQMAAAAAAAGGSGSGAAASAGIAAARRMQANVSPVRGSDAKRSRLVEYEDQEEVRRVRALSQPDEDSKRGGEMKRGLGYDEDDDGYVTRMRYGDDDTMEATVNNQQQQQGPSRSVGDDDLDTSLATWLQEQKRSVTMRKKPGMLTGTSTGIGGGGEQSSEVGGGGGGDQTTQRRDRTYMTVDDAAETVRDDEQMAFYASQPRHQRRMPDQYEDELFEDYGNMTLEDANTVAYDRDGGRGRGGGVSAVSVSAAVDDMHGSYDMHRPLRAKFANGEDADVIGMQCMLAQALIDDDLNNGSKYDDDDDDN